MKYLFFLLFLVCLTCCQNDRIVKKVVYYKNQIKVEWYTVSRITNESPDYIDIVEDNGIRVRIIECAEICDIQSKYDTLYVSTFKGSGNCIWKAKDLDIKIKIDTFCINLGPPR
jgi:hypothetical protein